MKPVGTTARNLTRLAVVREDETLTFPVFADALVRALAFPEKDEDLAALAGGAEDFAEALRFYHELGFDLLLVDQRAHDES